VPTTPEGDFENDGGIQEVMKWQFRTIHRSDTSIYTQLRGMSLHSLEDQYHTPVECFGLSRLLS
jgi:hypothetical protein